MRVPVVRIWTVVALLAVMTAACGNRLSRDEILAQNMIDARQGLAVGTDGSRNGGDATAGGDVAVGGTADGTGAGTAGGATGGAGTTPGRAGSGSKDKMVIGVIGYFSGLGGATMAPGRDVWTAWASSVNQRGGISGHPVELLIGDDGGNASRSVSIARDFVENKRAIVLTYVGSGLAIAEYAKQAKVPVVGTVLGYQGWNSSPGLFPPYSAADGTSFGLARGLRDAGVKKVASLYCVETTDCSDGATRFEQAAAQEGLEVVYKASYSVVQPDFTSECIQMRQRGVEGVYPIGDPASMVRMGRACTRQGLNLIWVTPTATDDFASMPEFDGAVSVSSAFPWFVQSGLPALEEYAAALKAFAPARLTSGNGLQTGSWVSGKVIEAAGAHLPDRPTKEAMFDALWSLKGETLGGLAPGRVAVTFTREQPTPDPLCMFFGRVKDGKWTAPLPPTPVCR